MFYAKSLKLSWEDIQKLFPIPSSFVRPPVFDLTKFLSGSATKPCVFKQSNLEQRLDLTKSGSTTINDLGHWIV